MKRIPFARLASGTLAVAMVVATVSTAAAQQTRRPTPNGPSQPRVRQMLAPQWMLGEDDCMYSSSNGQWLLNSCFRWITKVLAYEYFAQYSARTRTSSVPANALPASVTDFSNRDWIVRRFTGQREGTAVAMLRRTGTEMFYSPQLGWYNPAQRLADLNRPRQAAPQPGSKAAEAAYWAKYLSDLDVGFNNRQKYMASLTPAGQMLYMNVQNANTAVGDYILRSSREPWR